MGGPSPAVKATIGFWWWRGDFNRPEQENIFAVLRDGEPKLRAVATLEQIMTESRAAQSRGALPEYLEQLGRRVREALAE